jgi:hypothetical protein
MESTMNISKSNYISAKQCYKRLWLQKHQPENGEMDEVTKIRLDIGKAIEKLSWNLFPDGVLVEYDHNISNRTKVTKELLDNKIKIIYEAAFIYKNLIAICDIVVVSDEGIEIYEVKSSTAMKDTYYDDISFQSYVVEQCGYKVSKANIIHINNEYERSGELEYDKLFKKVDVTDKILKYHEEIKDDIPKISKIIEDELSDIDIGEHCNKPYQCEFARLCTAFLPDYSIFDLYRGGKKSFKYYYDGILTLEDLHRSGVNLTRIQNLQVEAKIKDSCIIDKEKIKEFLNTIKYPLYFLDFESYQEAIPAFDGCRPYQQIPFQYSVHYIDKENGKLKHKEFLAKEGTNPKEELAKQLCADISTEGSILAYNMGFEGNIIKNLAKEFPDLRKQLLKIGENLLDLIIPFRNGYYYDSAMKGSFSIKSVLPALFPNDKELDYKTLEIKNGTEAMNTFPLLVYDSEEERERKRKALLQYCKLDTYAMVKIVEKLKTL